MSEPAGPLKIDIHSDKLDLHFELRNPGPLSVPLAPFLEKLHAFMQNAAVANGFPMPGPTASPDYEPTHEAPEHPHGDGHHVPTDSLAEMVRHPCSKCLVDIAEAVRTEQERRNAEMS